MLKILFRYSPIEALKIDLRKDPSVFPRHCIFGLLNLLQFRPQAGQRAPAAVSNRSSAMKRDSLLTCVIKRAPEQQLMLVSHATLLDNS